jgi:carbon storage regulator
MLVLTRRIGEEIVIGGGIHVTVVAIEGTKVRLGITAPKDVAVDRKEIHDRRAEFTSCEPPLEAALKS